MNGRDSIVVIGGGHAAAQLCAGLAAAKQGRRVHLVCEEDELPYHRPPLSKSFLKDPLESVQWHRTHDWFTEAAITVHRGDPAVAVERSAHAVVLRSGTRLTYENLVLATGTRARCLPELSLPLTNVAFLRTAADARSFRDRLPSIQRLIVVGGGFIGLEVAATARALGKQVAVLESAPRLLMRSASPELADHVLQAHLASGIAMQLGVEVGRFEIAGDRLVSVAVNGVRHEVDTLLLGIGATPECSLAQDVGLQCDNGIVVDPHMRTTDPTILAIGDCTSFVEVRSGRRLRLESVQNANDQARTALATLSGNPVAHDAVPWFWSEQGRLRLQMAGLAAADGMRHRRNGASADSFSLLHYAADRLVCVESVDAPADHIAARRLLQARTSPDPSLACDPALPLKSFLK